MTYYADPMFPDAFIHPLFIIIYRLGIINNSIRTDAAVMLAKPSYNIQQGIYGRARLNVHYRIKPSAFIAIFVELPTSTCSLLTYYIEFTQIPQQASHTRNVQKSISLISSPATLRSKARLIRFFSPWLYPLGRRFSVNFLVVVNVPRPHGH